MCVAIDDERRHADDGAVDRRIDIGAGRGADVECRVRGTVTTELEPGRAAAAAAEDLVNGAQEGALVALPADWIERKRTVARGMEADRGHATLVDRQLEAQDAGDRH